jgi:tellurite resistance protein TerC
VEFTEQQPMFIKTLTMTYKLARRIVIATIGATVLLLGVAMIFLPGPAFVVIPAGLAILSLEFAWAKHWLTKLKDGADTTVGWFRKRRNGGCAVSPALKGDEPA